MMVAPAEAIYSGLVAAHRALIAYSHTTQYHHLSPEREALHALYMAMSQYYAEHRGTRMQGETVEFLQAVHEAMHSDEINHHQALEAAVRVIGKRAIAQVPGVTVALAQAYMALRGAA